MLSQKQTQRSMVVYSLQKQRRLIDFFDGTHSYAFSDTLLPRQEEFAAKANRIASGIRKKTTTMFAEPGPFKADNLLIDKPLLQFFQQKIALIDDARWVTETNAPPIAVNAIVISKSPELTMAECRAKFPCQLLVFDASNAMRKVQRWREECLANGWPFHDVRSSGAWVNTQ
jgi:hypothetical protein